MSVLSAMSLFLENQGLLVITSYTIDVGWLFNYSTYVLRRIVKYLLRASYSFLYPAVAC